MLFIAFIGHESFYIYNYTHFSQAAVHRHPRPVEHRTGNYAIGLGSTRTTAWNFLLPSAVWAEGTLMCSSEQGGCYTPQGKMHHSLTHSWVQTPSPCQEHIYRRQHSLHHCCFSLHWITHNFDLELVSELQTPDLEYPRLSVLRALSITGKCDKPNLHAPAPENPPSSCCTHLHDEAAVLLRLTEVGAHFKDAHRALLTQAHPGVVLFTLRQSVPECLEDLPDRFLAH